MNARSNSYKYFLNIQKNDGPNPTAFSKYLKLACEIAILNF